LTEAQIREAAQRVEKELAAKAAEISAAVEQLQIAVHPVLFQLYSDICSVEGVAPPPPPIDTHPSPPEVADCLKSEDYWAVLPAAYAPLLA
jgi:hypothetical protein